mgnify:CR=1 FL=1
MSTRAQVRFATREPGVSFNEHPDKIHAQFYVHHDGYPEGLGLQIATSISKDSPITSFYGEIEHVQDVHGDLEYIYYVWSDYDKSTWISIFEVDYEEGKCIFVGKPEALLKKYKLNTNDDG